MLFLPVPIRKHSLTPDMRAALIVSNFIGITPDRIMVRLPSVRFLPKTKL